MLYDVVIVGGGPGGLSAALALNLERASEIVRSDQFPLDQDLAQTHEY